MKMPTKIEWAEESWNPVTGCTPVSEGCENCYAARMAKRLAGRAGYPADNPFRVTLHPERLDQPAKWRKPRRIFVCSMGDLFHEDVLAGGRFGFIDKVMQVIYDYKQHIFIILTKRPENIPNWWAWETWPNLWLGVTAENQARADERIPVLLSIPAAVHFVSIEPCLGPVDLEKPVGIIGDRDSWVLEQAVGQPRPLVACPECDGTRYFQTDPHVEYCGACGGSGWGLDWVILGCETGPGRRTMQPVWARDVKDQCVAAGVPFFLKQMYRNDGTLWKSPQLDGQIWNQYPNNERNPNA